MVNEWVDIVGNVAFPIGVAIFVLLRLEKSMSKVEEALQKMTEALIRVEQSHTKNI